MEQDRKLREALHGAVDKVFSKIRKNDLGYRTIYAEHIDLLNAAIDEALATAPCPHPEGTITVNAITGPNGPFDVPASPGPPTEQSAAPMKCSCQPIHSIECVFKDARSSQYRQFYAAELGRGTTPAVAKPDVLPRCPICKSIDIAVSNEDQRWICDACGNRFDAPYG
jgi:hypothetical protein